MKSKVRLCSSKLRILSRVLVVMIIITSLINPVSNLPFNGANTKVLASVGEFVYGTSTPIGTQAPTATPVTDNYGNDFETAYEIEVGTEYQCVIDASGDYDYFKFVPETSGMYGFESTGSSNPYCEVYDKDKYFFARDYDGGVGDNFYCAVFLDENKTYYFRTTGSENSSYKVKVNLLADDHGHDSSTATVLELDTLTSGEINFSGDYDNFKFTPTVTGPYVVESTGATDVAGKITDYSVNRDISSTNKNFRITYTLTANQTYNIMVYHQDIVDKDYSNTGAYGIMVTKFSDDHGNTYDTATALEIGTPLKAVSESNGDVDYFKFTTTTAGMYSIESTGSAYTKGWLRDSSKNYITSDSYGEGYNFYIPSWLEANSTYYLIASASTVGDPYQVKVSPLNDDHGHGYSSATALTLNKEIKGQINFTGDYDYFEFTPTEAGPYVFESTGTTDVEGSLLISDQSSSDISETNKNFKITYSLNANQTYIIQVNHKYYYEKDDANTTGEYGIKVAKLPDDHGNNVDSATLIQVGEDVKVVKECDGDEDYLKFVPTVSGMYSLESTGTADTFGQLFDSSKLSIGCGYDSGVGNNFYITTWLDAGSTYYLNTYSYEVAQYTVKVSSLTDDYGNSEAKATELTLNTELKCEINYAGDYDYFKFTPTVSGTYVFESTGSTDVYGYSNYYGYKFDISSYNKNTRIVFNMTANNTYSYYIGHNNLDKDTTCTGAYGVKVMLLENYATTIKAETDLNVTQVTNGNYIKFVPASNGMYSIESTGTSETSAFLYDYRNIEIAYDYKSGNGQNFYMKVYLQAGKVYYILPYSTNSQPYTVKVTALTDDHGNDVYTATTITVGNEISGKIDYVGDYDYFKFVPTTSGPYAIESIGSTDVDGEIMWYHSNSDVDVSNKNFRLAYTMSANLTYYIKVWHKNSDKYNTPNTGNYGIKVTKLTDEFSDSIDTANLVDTQKLITTAFESINDNDYVKFVPATTGSYTIQSYDSLGVYGYLYDSSKQYLTSDFNSVDNININFKITYNLEANKTYYLGIFRIGNTYGKYSFAIFPGSDDHRNEISNASLVQVGVDAAGIFNYTGDVDCFRLLPSADGVYNIKSTGSMDTYCEIYDSVGNMLGSSDNVSDADLNFSITQSLLANHTYNIVIKNQNTINGTGSYTLKVTKTGPIGYIDSPKTSQTCNGNVDVRGWFLDPSGVSKVEVFVDGVSKGTAVYGGSRADVLKVYPWYSDANSGFHYVLDTSKLSNGAHSVKVCGTGKNGAITTIGTVSITVLPTIGSIDSPKANATVREKVNLYGWILDPNGVSKIEVLVDNALVGTATYGAPRSDVKSAYPLYNNANAGFQYIIDTSKLSEGKHTITAREISKNTSNPTLIRKVDIMVSKLPVIGWLDNPAGTAALKGKTPIWGWFLDISGVSKVNVLVDNVLVGQAVYGGTRNDVFVVHPQYNNKNSGFYYLLDTLKLSNGKHTLKIVEVGVHGEQTVKQKEITVNN